LEAEIDAVAKFMEDLQRLTIHVQQQDMWSWEGDSCGRYTVRSAYEFLNRNLLLESQDETFKALWEIKVPSKATIFACRLIRERLPTKNNLRKRNVETNDVTCPFCRSHDQDKAHLFFTCANILPLWWESRSWVNVVGAFSENPKQHFLQHYYYNISGLRPQRWQTWWIALTCCIWKHRNRMIFLNESFNSHNVMEDALFYCWT